MNSDALNVMYRAVDELATDTFMEIYQVVVSLPYGQDVTVLLEKLLKPLMKMLTFILFENKVHGDILQGVALLPGCLETL